MSSVDIRSGDNLWAGMEAKVISHEKLVEAQKVAFNERQFRAAVGIVKNSLTNGEAKTSQILSDAGYSLESAGTSQTKIVNKPSFQKLLDILLPDQLVLERHAELVGSRNERVAVSAVELAYKVKGHLKDNGPTAGAALLGIMLGQAKIDQPVAYVDVEVQPVNQETTTL